MKEETLKLNQEIAKIKQTKIELINKVRQLFDLEDVVYQAEPWKIPKP